MPGQRSGRKLRRPSLQGALLGGLLLLLLSTARAADMLVLKVGWAPIFCKNTDRTAEFCWGTTPFGAFRLNRLAAKTFEGKDVTGCTGPAFTSADVPQDLLPELACVWNSYAIPNNNEDLWASIWTEKTEGGICTGLSPSEWMRRAVQLRRQYNPDRVLKTAGIVGGNSTTSDAIVNAFRTAYGANVHVFCDKAALQQLSSVSLCFTPETFALIDCPAAWKNCNGTLYLNPGPDPTPQCARFFPGVAAAASPSPSPSPRPPSPSPIPSPPAAPAPSPIPSPPAAPAPSPSPIPGGATGGPVPDGGGGGGGGVNAAAIGVAVGISIAVVAAVATGIVIYRRRRRARLGGAPAAKPEPAVPPLFPASGPGSFDSPKAAGSQGLGSSPEAAAAKAATAGGSCSPADSKSHAASAAAGSGFSLAALALPLGKSWLRRSATRTGDGSQQGSGTSSAMSSALACSLENGCGSGQGTCAPLSPRTDPAAFSAVSGDGNTSSDLPPSYISTGWGADGARSLPSLDEDPLLSLISTRLATRRGRGTATPGTTAALSPATPSSGPMPGSRRLQLPAAVQQWEVRWEELSVTRAIGRGSFGRVYLANWRETPVAVKVLLGTGSSNELPDELELPDGVMRQLQEEAGVMCRMRHPHLVSFLGLCTLPPSILTEWCPRGSLYDVLKQGARSPAAAAELTWQRRVDIAVGAARGLLYLHLSSPPILHCDVKSANILLNSSWESKLADFNLSSVLHGPSPADGAAINPTWMAPELLQGGDHSMASDVYSLGLVCYEMLTWQLPWRGTPFQIRRWVLDGRRPEVPPREALPGPDSASWPGLDAYCALMRDCWAADPALRPSCGDVLARLRAIAEM